MRICLNLLAATAGGQLTRASAFISQCQHYRKETELLVLKEKSVLAECKPIDGLEIIDVSIGLGHFKAAKRLAWENFVMPSVLQEKKVDVYLTFSHYLPRVFPKALPSVVGVSNLAPFSDLAWDAESWLVRMKMLALKRSIVSSSTRADRVIALSNTCRDILVNNGVTENKVIVAPNGVGSFWSETSSDGEVLHDNGIDRPYLLYVSHFYRYKNFQQLLNAFALLPPEIKETYKLVLVGKPYNKRYYDEIRALQLRLGLEHHISIIAGENGQRLRHLYQHCALFVFPSLIENSPNILLEAMAAGSPVLASKYQPMPEFGGEASEYVDPLNAREMAEKISVLLNDPPTLAEMKLRSRKQAQHYTWNGFVDKVLYQCQLVGDMSR